jgi:hypothetical protein
VSPDTLARRNARSPRPPVSSRQQSGDPSAVEPPVPIPNTAVKHCSADGSATKGCARVGRRQTYQPRLAFVIRGCSFFCRNSEAQTPDRGCFRKEHISVRAQIPRERRYGTLYNVRCAGGNASIVFQRWERRAGTSAPNGTALIKGDQRKHLARCQLLPPSQKR